MDYHRHYGLLIERARHRTLKGYSELHHVIPRCLGGGDDLANLVRLTPEEHFIAHLLLMKMHPDNRALVYAAAMMTVFSDRTIRRSRNRQFGWLKRRIAAVRSSPEVRQIHSERAKSDPRIIVALKKAQLLNVGVPRSDDVKMKVSASHKTSQAAATARALLNERKVGVPRSQETKRKMSEAQKGRTQSAEHRAAISTALKGKPKSPEHNAKVSEALKGKPGPRLGATTSEETKQKQREAALRRYYPDGNVPPPKVTDPKRSARAYKAWETKRSRLTAQPTS